MPSYEETFPNFQQYAKAQLKYIVKVDSHNRRKSDLTLRRLNEEKAIFDPIRDEAIIFAVNNPSETEGLALLQFMDEKGVAPTLPLSDGRLLIDLVVAKQAEPTPEGQDPTAWATNLEEMRIYAEQLTKLYETVAIQRARNEASREALANSMEKLTIWKKYQEQDKALDAAHNATVVKAGQEYLEAKQTALSSSSK